MNKIRTAMTRVNLLASPTLKKLGAYLDCQYWWTCSPSTYLSLLQRPGNQIIPEEIETDKS
jgi:hypothetical protein